MNRIKHHGSHIIKITIAYFIATILLLWGWNSAIPDLFALPTMQFKQATGLIILIGTASFLLRCGRSHDRDKNVDLSRFNSIMKKQS
jgi:hypothetical protein